MKNLFRLILVLPVLIAGFLVTSPSDNAEAATSGWESIYGISGCQVRVWNDAYNYTKNASTIDAYAETNGKCGTLTYKAYVVVPHVGRISNVYNGTFAHRTPTKSFYLNSLSASGVDAWVSFDIYKNGKLLGDAYSPMFSIYKR
ncbi:cell wall-binding protein [Priestia endophytica]|uniref:cell wall-binding protein n=1 Tax=Priestia endophytica TaxID=135735 RepID=UPI000DE5BC08|nr:cell wall-binding protein [Priestia endophytica]